MVGEVFAGLGAIKAAFDIAKGLKDIWCCEGPKGYWRCRPTQCGSHRTPRKNPHRTASANDVGWADRRTWKEVASIETWNVEKGRYKLTDYGGGTFAYALKPEEAQDEPPHRISLPFDFSVPQSLP